MTKPLTPPDCDLRDYPYMPVDIVRLFGSEFHACSDDSAWRAGVTLWLKSYHQVPAASLPDDDMALARLAEFGRDQKTWRKVKAAALRGWMKADDGRLYHPVVAEKALEGWIEKLVQRKASAAGNAKKYSYEFDPRPIEAAVADAVERLRHLNPGSRVIAKRALKPAPGRTLDGGETIFDEVPDGSQPAPGGRIYAPGGSSEEARKPPDGSPGRPPADLPSGSQGKGREGNSSSSLRSEEPRARDLPSAGRRSAAERRHPFPPDAFERWYADYPHKVSRGTAERAFAKIVASDAVSFEELCAGVRRYRLAKPHGIDWRNPATWLNGEGWLDQPAGPSSAPALFDDEQRIDLGGGFTAAPSSIRQVWKRGSWPRDWGPRPGEAGCRVPPALEAELLRAA